MPSPEGGVTAEPIVPRDEDLISPDDFRYFLIDVATTPEAGHLSQIASDRIGDTPIHNVRVNRAPENSGELVSTFVQYLYPNDRPRQLRALRDARWEFARKTAEQAAQQAAIKNSNQYPYSSMTRNFDRLGSGYRTVAGGIVALTFAAAEYSDHQPLVGSILAIGGASLLYKARNRSRQ